MAGTEDRVVAMSFESSKFESGASHALSMLEKLKQALNFSGSSKGLDNINAAANKVDLSHISNAVDGIKSKFSALSIAALAVFANIATRAVSAGGQLVKSLTLDPIIAGFHEYETGLNAVQTILSNTTAAGTGLKEVNATLNDLNHYADKTIYNFSEMTRNIGTFTAAGVDLKTAAASIKGIANLAALSGSSSEQASTAMYQLSQAISAGRVSLQDWNSVVNAGMGGTVFQRALAQTAVHMGALKEGAVQLVGPMKNVTIEGKSFRESIQAKPGQQSWLTGKVLTTTLEQLSGNLSIAQLKARGYSDEQAKAIQTQAKAALDAATQVKTLSQLIDTTKEAIGSGWAQTFQTIFGDFGEAKTLFTGLSNAIGGFVSASAKARNGVLKDWKDLGGRTLLLHGIKQAFQDLVRVVQPIKDAFRDIFPAKTGKDLYDATSRFEKLTEALRPSDQTVQNLQRTFRGFFAALDIGKQILGGIFTVFGKLFGVVGQGAGNFLNFTGNIGDFIVSIDNALKKSKGFHDFFATLGTVLAVPIKLLQKLKDIVVGVFTGFDKKDSAGFSDAMSSLGDAIAPLQGTIQKIKTAWNKFISNFANSGQNVGGIVQTVANAFANFGPAVANAIQSTDFSGVFRVINVALLGGIFLLLKKFASGNFLKGFGGGILSNLSGLFGGLTGSLQAFQQNVKADTMLKIAGAIGILAASLVALSLIPEQKLNTALSGLAVAFGELLGAMKLLDKIGAASAGFLKIPVIAAGMVILAGAVGLLVVSVKALSGLNWDQLQKGLIGVSTLLAGIALASGPLSRNSAGLISAGLGITAIAIALRVLAGAVKDFGGLSWTQLGKGIGSVAVSLGAIGAASKLFPTGMVAIGLGLIGVATALKMLAGAVSQFGNLNIGVIVKGLAGIGGALVTIGLSLKLMPKSVIAQAAGLILVSLALKGIGKAVDQMGGMSLGKIAKGILTLAGSLTVLSVALKAMTGTVGGSAALGLAAAGIALMAPALKTLGGMSWGDIAKGMAALAASLVILGAAGALIGPVAPALLALGVALLAIGGAMLAAGAGVALLGTGLSAIAVAGPAAVSILVKALLGFASTLPKIMQQFATGLVQMVVTIGNNAPAFVGALVKILDQMLNAIVTEAPKIAQAFTALLAAALKAINDNMPKIVQTGLNMLMALLRGISNNIGKIVQMAVTVIVNFLNAVASNLGRVMAAGTKVLASFIQGIANNIGTVVTKAADVIISFVRGITSNLGRIVAAGANAVISLVSGIANNVGRVISAGLNMVIHFLQGIANGLGKILSAGVTIIGNLITGLASAAVKLIDQGMQALVYFLQGVAAAVRKYTPQIMQAGVDIGVALVRGVIDGLASMAAQLFSAIGGLFSSMVNKAKNAVKAHSPSEVFHEIGTYIVQGLANGITATGPIATQAMIASAGALITAVKALFGISSPSRIMYDIGKFVGEGFRNGLLGTRDDINQAFADMHDKLNSQMVSLRQTISDEKARLDQLLSAKHINWREVNEARNALQQNQQVLARLSATNSLLSKGLNKQKQELIGLANEYAGVAAKLEDAKNALDAAKKARDDAVAAYSDQYAKLPDLASENPDQLTAYFQALQNQVVAVQTYSDTLDQLRKLGLDDATYKKLLQEGPADQAFANQLLAGGATAIGGLNRLDAQLQSAAGVLASHAGTNLYQAGVDAAQGIVNGLASQEAAIVAEMTKIAKKMIDALKKKLKIKSPSEEMAELGRYSSEGMARGLSDSSNRVAEAAANVGTKAVSAIKKAMNAVNDAFAFEVDTEPTISPVIDLTSFRSGAQQMNDLMAPVLNPTVSADQATSISSAQQAAQTADTPQIPGVPTISYQQNNYSPESLSEIEIYRQTKNQLSQLKTALAIP